MKIATTLAELDQARSSLPGPVGFVPTMGYLHAGHLSLVKRAKAECASLVASIFVNPAQFGPQEDFSAYPRDLERDLTLLHSGGCDLVWTPTPEIMYPPGYQTWIMVEDIAKPLEGSMRPGHFRGVATIVAKLFNAVQPQCAYFGQKDAQQLAVIQRMTKDLNMPVQIIGCPTVREADGLALSSRNTYLNPHERKAASVLYRALCSAKAAFDAGENQAESLRQIMRGVLAKEPLAQPQYISCADPISLVELEDQVEEAILSLAVYIGKTRLIDNIVLQKEGNNAVNH